MVLDAEPGAGEVWVVGEGSDPKVTRLQIGSIQSVNEGVDNAGGVVDLQRGVPLLPPRGVRRRGRGSKVAFLVSEFRLPSSSWPPCVTTINSFAHHARFAKTWGGRFSSPRRLSPPESWTFSAQGGESLFLASVGGEPRRAWRNTIGISASRRQERSRPTLQHASADHRA